MKLLPSLSGQPRTKPALARLRLLSQGWWLACVMASAWIASPHAWAQDSRASGTVYVCQTPQGTITSDRYIPQCSDREQKQYFRDGTASRVIPPTYTAHERLAIDEKKAREKAIEEDKSDVVRRDRQLLRRYGNEAMHKASREKSLEPVFNAQKVSKLRMAALEDERKPLREQAEFYKGKKLPAPLQLEFEVVDAAEEAILIAMKVQREEIARINEMYDIEIERLRKLWGGAQPGSLGPMRQPSGSSAEAKAAEVPKTAEAPTTKTTR
jgi:hypothetical protein